MSAPHDVPHLTTSEPDTLSSVVRPPEHARADDAAVPTGAGGRPRAPPISRRRRVSYAPPPRARAMLRRGSPPCDACAASPRRGRPIVLLNHATLRLRAPPERRFRPFFWLTTEHEPSYTRTPRRVRQRQPYAEKKAISRLAPGEQTGPASIMTRNRPTSVDGFLHKTTPPTRTPTDAPPTQNDPHKLRRLRRPTGPRRAAMRTL